MSGLYLKHVVVAAAVCSVLAAVVLGSPVLGPEPIRCAPCTPERLSECPAVAPECAEVLREPGCGCCLACALNARELCGIYTAPCGSGLRCTPRPGDLRPLHALTSGQAVCTEITEPEQRPEPQNQGRPITPDSRIKQAIGAECINLSDHVFVTVTPAQMIPSGLPFFISECQFFYIYSKINYKVKRNSQPWKTVIHPSLLFQIRKSLRWRTQPSRTPAPVTTSPVTASPSTRGPPLTLRRA